MGARPEDPPHRRRESCAQGPRDCRDTRSQIIRLAMRGMYLVARRFATFVARKDGFCGWRCNASFGDEEALRGIFIPDDQPKHLRDRDRDVDLPWADSADSGP